MRKLATILLLTLAATACEEKSTDIVSVEQRTSDAITSLRADLLIPANGWRLDYQPTPESGTLLILLNFDQDGNVNIQSDVPDDNGTYYDQTSTYRIDSGQGLELIFETFGVFHFLFELDQATFGAEFEWAFLRKEGENLVFESISDVTNKTIITLAPASSTDGAALSRELSANLNKFDTLVPQILAGILPSQQIILDNDNISFFWTIDLRKRIITAELAGVGTTVQEVLTGQKTLLDHTTGYTLNSGKLILNEPFSFVADGKQREVSELTLTTFDMTGPSLCLSTPSNTNPKYVGQLQNGAPITMVNSALTTRGAAFVPSVYQAGNATDGPLIWDGDGERLSEVGSINDKFPTAIGFIMFYGVELNDPTIPINSIGFFFPDDESSLYLREFEPVQTNVNQVKIKLLDNYHFSTTPPPTAQQDLQDITNEIFAGEDVFAYINPLAGLTVITLYNPCNAYEVIFIE